MKSKYAVLKLITAAVLFGTAFQAGSAEAGPFDKLKKKVKEVKEVKDVIDVVTDSSDKKDDTKETEKNKNTGANEAEKDTSLSNTAIGQRVIGSSDGLERFSLTEKQSSGRKYLISAQGQKLMRLQADGSRVRVICDGVESEPYSTVDRMCLSPNGASWGFVGNTNTRSDVIVNGKVLVSVKNDEKAVATLPDQTLYDNSQHAVSMMTKQSLGPRSILFSPDGSRSVCVISANPKFSVYGASHGGLSSAGSPYEVYLDGEKLIEVESIGMITFTPGNRLVLITGETQKKTNSPRRVYIDDEAGPELNGVLIQDIGFDVTGEHLIYTTHAKDDLTYKSINQLYLDNKPMVDPSTLPEGDVVKQVKLDDTLTTVGVVTESKPENQQQGGVWTLRVNGKVAGELIQDESFVLGPDGKYVMLDRDNRVVVNGKKGLDYKELLDATFSRNSEVLRFAVKSQLGNFIVDEHGNETGPFQGSVNRIEITTDGSRSAIFTYEGLLIDGNMVIPSSIAKPNTLEVSDDLSTIYLYGKSVIDEQTRERADAAGVRLVAIPNIPSNGAVSKDGRYVAYLRNSYDPATKSRSYTLHVNDQQVGDVFDEAGEAMFDEHNTLHFLARRGTQIIACTYSP